MLRKKRLLVLTERKLITEMSVVFTKKNAASMRTNGLLIIEQRGGS
jgi:hypothetical protein